MPNPLYYTDPQALQNLLSGGLPMQPMQQAAAQVPQVPQQMGVPQPGPTGTGIMSALSGKDPTALMMLGANLLSASGPTPRKMGFGARLGDAVGQTIPQVLNQQSIQERTALSKQELAQRQAEHQMGLDRLQAVSNATL